MVVDRDLPLRLPPPRYPPQKAHCATTRIQISQLWDLIETWGFHEDLKPIVLCF